MSSKDPEAQRKYHHEYYLKHRAEYIERAKQSRKRNPERHKEYARKGYERRREGQREYARTHKAEALIRQRQYRAKHLKEVRERSRKWANDHPESRQQHKALRRSNLAKVECEKFSRNEIYERDGGVCHLCGKKCKPNAWHLDHLMPISKVGSHTRRNVAVSCPKCNQSKNNNGRSQLRLW